MNLSTRLTALAEAIGADIKALDSALVDAKPGTLMVYYGYPIAYRGLWAVDTVVTELSKYNDWVVGDAYMNPSHEAYATTAQIVAGVRARGTRVWGYVPTGVSTANLTLAEIQTRVGQWVAVGVDGIFFDEFGFDYGTTRVRQRACVSYARAAGLPYVANTWVPADVYYDSASELPPEWAADDWRRVNYVNNNPGNLPLDRQTTDVFLMENYGVNNEGVSTIWDFLDRVNNTVNLNATKGKMRLWGLSVVRQAATITNTYRDVDLAYIAPFASLDALAQYLFAAAMVHQIDAWGLGGYYFGSDASPVRNTRYAAPVGSGKPGVLETNINLGYQRRNFGTVTITVHTGLVLPLNTANTYYSMDPAVTLGGIATVTGLQAALDAKEPSVAGSMATNYWNGLKGWSDFGGSVRQALLTSIDFTVATALVAGDTVLAGLGKLQAQITKLIALTPLPSDATKTFTWTPGTGWVAAAAGGAGMPPMLHVQDQKPTGTPGGASVVSTSSSGVKRPNPTTVLVNEIGASVSSNGLIIDPGKYYVECTAPFSVTSGSARLIIFDEEAGDVLLRGSAIYLASNTYSTFATVSGMFEIADPADISIRYQCPVAQAIQGLGRQSDLTPYEIYTDLKLWKLIS